MPKDLSLPFTATELETLVAQFPTPLYVYDERGIRNSARALNNAFTWAPGFRNYFAVKALPNPHILHILQEEGMGMDCSSLPELLLAEMIHSKNIMFTSNNTPPEEFTRAESLGAIINVDDISHTPHVGTPEIACFRYNPGNARTGNSIIGNPEEAKYGLTKEQLREAYNTMKAQGVNRFGIHTMVASNELDEEYFVDTARMMFELTRKLSEELGINFEFINLGGGIGIPYKPSDSPVDITAISEGIQTEYEEQGLSAKLAMECGRYVTGPHGYLVTRVRHVMEKHRSYVGVDATMANLMRPGMYGAYHHITVVGKEREPSTRVYDVVGSLCENNDKFAIQRALPSIESGDLLVIHDAGAHAHAMGFQYNGKLRSAEVLLQEDRTPRLIRRAETVDDYFATLVL